MSKNTDIVLSLDQVTQIEVIPTILDVVCKTTGMGFAAVARVTDDSWVACAVRDEIDFGLKPGGELDVKTTICHEIEQHREAVFINHVAQDDVWRDHRTPQQYGFQSYISVPIVLRDGHFFGTLCAIDREPADVRKPSISGMMKLFAELIAFHLDAQRKMQKSDNALDDERHTSELREQFIAVLGHDLKNPLAAFQSGLHLLSQSSTDDRTRQVTRLMQQSADRMHELVDNVLDFARGRLGGGIPIHPADTDISVLVSNVVAELQSSHPGRDIRTTLQVDRTCLVDPGRMAQVVSNLLANALTHGATDEPIIISARTDSAGLMLSVCNGGDEIDEVTRKTLFHPFFRGRHDRPRDGLGLGLYITSEIVSAHNGALTVSSSPEQTCFNVFIPHAQLLHAVPR
ncbi:GAF domain-containing sensor histidine kinase [Parvularcula sp. LCG005]|uniref:GAF domain-containing sensor histidine kinase n=1 Tax=Parvularcula sp. LCG005 TaxID=3078805 RepID=UPI002942E01B|nr:GAF domain-containing sensor histidine kinase [Parvularcula sp. LCG005]WOI53809.1 GAF domain-containing sensor histidine kinase [Parvularcula sp. LCG005]